MRRLCLSLLLFGVFCVEIIPARAAVIISEFLAENDGGLEDENGDSPDWIELFNNSLSPLDLGGWHLTDNPTNLTKWTFPATNLNSGAFLVVFASGKDRAVAGAPLHTSFSLQNGGGYLALVQPNGTTIASEFYYPPQHRNVSFGGGSSNNPPVTLLAASASAKWLVPSGGGLGSLWTTAGFDDSGWNTASAPLRYDVTAGGSGSAVLNMDVNMRGANDTAGNTQTGFSAFTIGGTAGATQSGAITRSFGGLSVTLSNSGPAVYDDRFRNTPTDGGSFTAQNLLRDFVFSRETGTSTNGLDLYVAGLGSGQTYDFRVWSFDSGSAGSRVSDWFANGLPVTNNYTFNGSVLPTTDNQYSIAFRATASASGLVLISARRDASSVDTANAASFGVFFNGLQISSVNATPVTNGNLATMAGQNSSVFVRQTFTVTSPGSINQLTLRMNYNDGFVAYLNGTEVARRNAPTNPDWNSMATATHSAAASEDILLPGAESLLLSGTNVLAIQGLATGSADADFYLEPQLIGTSAILASNRYFSPSSPGLANGFGYGGVVADTKFSANRGFYDTPFSLTITTATAGASIYFTTNGSAPSPSNGFLFSSPINITGHSFIRAAAYSPGLIPSGIDTHSYVFLRDVLSQSNNLPGYPTTWQASYPADYAMDSNIVNHPVYGATISNDLRSIPSLMIVSDQNGLWNASTGIYPNSTSSGPSWERAASVELIGGDGSTEFATTARLEMHGNASRDNARTPKHSMRLGFNSDYGPTRLDYNWFGGGVRAHDGIVLRSCGFVDGWAGRYADNTIYTSSETGEQFRGLRYRPENTCYLRDVWMKDSFEAMGWLSSRSAFVHLYLNGLYWGLYQPSEKYGAAYYSAHLGGDEGAWDVIVGEDNNGPPVLVDGSLTDWTNLLAIANAGITNEIAYAAVTNRIEVDNLIDYMLLHIFGESEDWPRHNWYAAHRRATNGLPESKFIISVWDQELTLDRLVRRDRTNVGGSGGEIYSPARIYQQLRNWPEFRRQFGDRVHKHLFNDGALTPSNNVARFLAKAAMIREGLVGESARWGDARRVGVPAGQIGTGVTFTRDEWWQPEIDKMTTNFFQHLTADNVARLRAVNLYPVLDAPRFSQFGGAVEASFQLSISHTNAGGVIYYTTDGSDPRSYGTGAVDSGAQAYLSPLSLLGPTVIRARVLSAGSWSALTEAIFYPPQNFTGLVITELMFNPLPFGSTNGDDFEFLELRNNGTNTMDLSGLTFSEGITFTFTNGTMLSTGQFFVLARSAEAFSLRYGAQPDGVYAGQLNNGGETITLSHALGNRIFTVTYDDVAPWPMAADGYGYSIEPRNPFVTKVPDEGGKWKAGALLNGTPWGFSPASPLAEVVINEILTHTDLPQVDRIELANLSGFDAQIGGWFLTDEASVPKKFRIPDGTVIPAHGYLAFDESQFNATPGTNNSFSLSSWGEQLYLLSGDANTNLTEWSHGLTFGAAANGVSFGRFINSIGEEHFPAQISNSFGASNAGPRIGPLVINEIHYHPDLGNYPFVELKNISTTNVPLFDPLNPFNAWKLDGLGFTFPPNVTVPPNGMVLLVASNPPGFIARYSLPPDIQVFSYESMGELQFSGERLSLSRPGTPDTNGVPQITVETVRYNDQSPWPAAADGSGFSLQRRAANLYADDPASWLAAPPTPGRDNSEADSDGDGMPDAWETANGTLIGTPDATGDLDGDGFTNLLEYLAGTNPNDAESRLEIRQASTASNGVRFEFIAASNRTYRVLVTESLSSPAWSVSTNVPAALDTRKIVIQNPTDHGQRFFRVTMP